MASIGGQLETGLKIDGGTDLTSIGNVSDRLKTDTSPSVFYPTDAGTLYSFAATVTMPTSGVNNPLILIRNPSGSGKTLRFWRITLGTSIANVSVQAALFYAPTITSNGTAATPRQMAVGNSNVSSALVTTTPTLSNVGTQLLRGVTGQNAGQILLSCGFEVSVAPNSTVVLTGDPGSNNRAAEICMIWAES